MKKYTVPVTFEFNGIFTVNADNLADAIKKVKESCGMTMGEGDINSSLPECDIDWMFDKHPIKTIMDVTGYKRKNKLDKVL